MGTRDRDTSNLEASGDPARFRFPVYALHPLEHEFLLAMSLVLAAVLIPVALRIPERLHWFRVITLAVLALVFGGSAAYRLVVLIREGFYNARVRREWLGSYPRVLRRGELQRLIAAAPGRYRLHAQGYGAFDWSRPDPAYLLENRETGEVFPVPFGAASTICEAAGVRVIWH